MGLFIGLTATSKEVATIVSLARGMQGVEDVSEPSRLGARRALNAGLTPEDIKTGLELVKIIFESGAAFLVFLQALREEMRASSGAVGVSDAASGKPLGRVEAGTTDEAITRIVPP